MQLARLDERRLQITQQITAFQSVNKGSLPSKLEAKLARLEASVKAMKKRTTGEA
jgi:ABC-type phosphate transport system auxiliary subunit